MPPIFAVLLLALCQFCGSGSTARSKKTVIRQGLIPSVQENNSALQYFWIYGNFSLKATHVKTRIMFQEDSTGFRVHFTKNGIRIHSPRIISLQSERGGKLLVTGLTSKSSFIAFDRNMKIYEDVLSANTSAPGLTHVCPIVSDETPLRSRLRSHALDLIRGALPVIQLPPGAFMACMKTVSEDKMKNPSRAGNITLQNLPPTTSNNGALQAGFIKNQGNNCIFFEKVIVFGNFNSPISFGEAVVIINEGYNSVRLTSNSIDLEDPKLAVTLDHKSGIISMLKDPNGKGHLGAFVVNEIDRSILDLLDCMKPTIMSYICFAFALEPPIINILSTIIFDLLQKNVQLPTLPAGSLLVCAQVTTNSVDALYPSILSDQQQRAIYKSYHTNSEPEERGPMQSYPSSVDIHQHCPNIKSCQFSDPESYGYFPIDYSSLPSSTLNNFEYYDQWLSEKSWQIPECAMEICHCFPNEDSSPEDLIIPHHINDYKEFQGRPISHVSEPALDD